MSRVYLKAWTCFLWGLFTSTYAAKTSDTPESLRPWMRELLYSPTPKKVRPGVLRFEKSYERTNKNTGEHLSLRYTVERKEDAFMNLDKETGLVSVECAADTMTLHVEGPFSMPEYLKWTQYNNTGRLIYGGIQWGCQNPKSQDVGPIFKSMESMPVIRNETNSTLVTIMFQARDASPFSFFGRSQVSFYTNESMVDTRQLREIIGGDVDITHLLKDRDKHSTTYRKYGNFPGDRSPWGYGIGAHLINWNYDVGRGEAVKSKIEITDSLTCQDCYIYAGAGIGFEFQTEAFDYFPTYLVYLKLWAQAEAAYSLNVYLETSDASQDAHDPMSNMLLNGDDEDVDFRDPSWTPKTDKILSSDIVMIVAGIVININFRLPTFLQWQINTGGEGIAYAGSYYKAAVAQGIVYMNSDHADECSMPGCIKSCSGWCPIKENVVKQGGSGPVWTFKEKVDIVMYLTPILVIEVWSGTVSGFIQADAKALLSGSAQSGCLSVSVFVDAAAYVWGRLHISVWSIDLINIQSSVFTLFESIGQRKIIDLPCISVEDAASSNCPFAVERAVQTSQTAVLKILSPGGSELASLTVDAASNADYSSHLPSSSSFEASTMIIRAETSKAKPDPQTGQYLPVCSTIKLTPAGAQLRSTSRMTFLVQGKGSRRGDTGKEYCERSLLVMSQANTADAPWELSTVALDCSRFPSVTLPITTLLTYRVVQRYCGEGRFDDGNMCQNCTVCAAGKYTASNCSEFLDTVCLPCKTCDSNAIISNGCLAGSKVDTVVCTCSPGFRGNGIQCSPCTLCPPNATTTSTCSADSDTVCTCNAGFFGSGLMCSPCAECPLGKYRDGCRGNRDYDDGICYPCMPCGPNDYVKTPCAGASPGFCMKCTDCDPNAAVQDKCNGATSNDQKCTSCNSGFYGTGVQCTPCKTCHPSATTSGACPAGSTSDGVVCTCPNSFYGDGIFNPCMPCTTCPSNAILVVECSTSEDTVCKCNKGYYRDWAYDSITCSTCSKCSAGWYQMFECSSTYDTVCTRDRCYGNQYIKTPATESSMGLCANCKKCDDSATQQGSCNGTTLTDIVCTCNAGYYGTGEQCAPCTPCAPGSYLLSECTAKVNTVCSPISTTILRTTSAAAMTTSPPSSKMMIQTTAVTAPSLINIATDVLATSLANVPTISVAKTAVSSAENPSVTSTVKPAASLANVPVTSHAVTTASSAEIAPATSTSNGLVTTLTKTAVISAETDSVTSTVKPAASIANVPVTSPAVTTASSPETASTTSTSNGLVTIHPKTAVISVETAPTTKNEPVASIANVPVTSPAVTTINSTVTEISSTVTETAAMKSTATVLMTAVSINTEPMPFAPTYAGGATSALQVSAAAALVHLQLELNVTLDYFNAIKQRSLRESLALAAGLTRADAQLITLVLQESAALRRGSGAGGVLIDVYIACPDASAAASVAAALTASNIDSQLSSEGLPAATIVLAPVVQLQASNNCLFKAGMPVACNLKSKPAD